MEADQFSFQEVVIEAPPGRYKRLQVLTPTMQVLVRKRRVEPNVKLTYSNVE